MHLRIADRPAHSQKPFWVDLCDKIAHEKKWTAARKYPNDIFDFATDFNAFVQDADGFKPFWSLNGFKGRKESLSKETTRWVLRDMGIPAKAEKSDF